MPAQGQQAVGAKWHAEEKAGIGAASAFLGPLFKLVFARANGASEGSAFHGPVSRSVACCGQCGSGAIALGLPWFHADTLHLSWD